jgi:hypothetical protein
MSKGDLVAGRVRSILTPFYSPRFGFVSAATRSYLAALGVWDGR